MRSRVADLLRRTETWSWPTVALPGTASVLFFALGIVVIRSGHLHEDAYILYIYSENLARSGAITYFIGGNPAEGATDFLWMVVLALPALVGVATPIAALVLNTLGVFTLTLLIVRVARAYGASWAILLPLVLLVPVHPAVLAGVAGFSTPTFSALALLMYVVAWRSMGPGIVAVPILGLLLGLFRPDGVILGALSALIAFRYAGDHRRRYLVAVGICGALGLAYFFWRWDYFGEVLPLPLVVKSGTGLLLPGLRPNLAWLQSNAIIPLLGMAAVIFTDRIKPLSRPAVLAVPFLSHFMVLATATQSQNVADRFNAPSSALILLASVLALAVWCERRRDPGAPPLGPPRRVAASALALTITGVLSTPQAAFLVDYLQNDDYINFFPYHFAPAVPESAVTALTEAGRFAYWVPGEKHDLVGLNTPAAARRTVDIDYLIELQPDIVFLHRASVFPAPRCGSGQNFCRVDPQVFSASLEDAGTFALVQSTNHVTAASAIASTFLADQSSRYAIYSVRYGGSFDHLYGIRMEGVVTEDAFIRALEVSFSAAGRLSFADMMR